MALAKSSIKTDFNIFDELEEHSGSCLVVVVAVFVS